MCEFLIPVACRGAQALGSGALVAAALGFWNAGSVVAAHGLINFPSMWDLSGAGIKPVSPALAGGFLPTVSPGKFKLLSLYWRSYGASRVLLESNFKELFLHPREVSKK